MIQAGDVVRLKADGGEDYPMLVVDVRRGCDGTSGDGDGLLCGWRDADDGRSGSAWLSESSVFTPAGVKWGVGWDGLPIGT